MVEEEASQMGEARGNVASGEGAMGSAEQTHTCGQEQHAYGRVNVAARKAKRLVPIGKTAKGKNS